MKVSTSRAYLGWLLLVTACPSQDPELQKWTAEADNAEKRLAEAKVHLDRLKKEEQDLLGQLKAQSETMDGLHAHHVATLKAAGALASGAEDAFPVDGPFNSARLGYQFDKAVESKDTDTVVSLAHDACQAVRRCTAAEAPEEPGEEPSGCGACDVEPYVDACANVPETISAAPSWTCDTFIEHAHAPTVAFCTARIHHPADSNHSLAGLPTELALIRAVYVDQGHAWVADFPVPSQQLFNPRNTEALEECQQQTALNRCRHECDVSFDRYQNPCGCEGDGYEGYGDGPGYEGETEPEDIPENVREAREAAARAEAEAQAAEAAAEQARQELRYQECLSNCEPASGEGPPGEEYGAQLQSVDMEVRLESSPAPGVFLVQVDTDIRTATRSAGVLTSTQLLAYPRLLELVEKGPTPPANTNAVLDSLELLAEGADERYLDLHKKLQAKGELAEETSLPDVGIPIGVAWITMKEHTGKVLVLPTDHQSVSGYVFTNTKGTPVIQTLDHAVVCTAISKNGSNVPEGITQKCTAPLPVRDAGPRSGPADAGMKTEPTDAGASKGSGDAAEVKK